MFLSRWFRSCQSNAARPVRRPRRRARPLLEPLEDRTLLNGNTLATAMPVGLNDTQAEQIATSNEIDCFQVAVTESGLLTVQTQPAPGVSLASRLSLLGPDGQTLVQSDGASATQPGGSISQHVVAGTYFVEVAALSSTTGAYTLTTGFQLATAPFEQVPVGSFLDRFMVAGDFNNDGRIDLATANNGSNDLSVLLGLGDGTFGPAARFQVGSAPIDIVAEDFDGDGFLDLAVTNSQGINDVSVLLGNGDGTFQDQVRYATGGYHGGLSAPGGSPGGLSAADFNGDGRLDLVASNQFGVHSLVSVLLGNGDGTFGAHTTFAVGFSPRFMAVGDFNDDGRPDLAVANSDSSDVSVLLGNGDGTFQEQVRFAVGLKPSHVITADFNGDGVLDLVTTNVASNDLSVLLGRGDGTFRDQVRLPVGNLPECPVAADLNGDGRMDLAVTNLVDDDVSVLLGNGDGTFQNAGRFAVAFQPFTLVAADFDGDGRLDLAASNQVSEDVSVLLGKGDGTFQEQDPEVAVRSGPATGFAGGAGPTAIVEADFNGDGRADLAVPTFYVGRVAVFLGRGDGTFQDAGQYPVGTSTMFLIAGDFNGDGRLDLAAANKDSADVAVLLGNGDGTFQDAVATFVGLTRLALAAGDFNGDGLLDLAVTRSNSLSTTVRILLGRDDGTSTLAGDYTAGSAPKVPVVADFDGDGFLDLAVTNQGSNDVSVLLGNGDGTFRDQVRYVVGTAPFGLAVADLNGDGHFDLVAANVLSNDVSVLLGNGDGTFGEQRRYPAGLISGWVSTGDFDGDGLLDLAVLDSGTPTVSVLLGRGDGTFGELVQFAVGGGEGAIAVGDLNGDGRADLAVSNLLIGDVSLLLGHGDGTFQDERRFPVAVGPAVVAAADFDGDSLPDLARVNPATDTLTVSLGLGDGHFQNPLSLPVGRTPVALLAADLNGDGRADLATANFLSGDVTVFLGLGDGQFEDPLSFAIGFHPTSLAAGDFNSDGQADLAVTGPNAGAVAVLLGNGDGSFGTPQILALPGLPLAVDAGDFNGDGHDDLAVADEASHDVVVLLGNGGSFRSPLRLALGTAPVALVTGDFDGDGHLDLATADFTTNDVSVLLGKGDGTFHDAVRWAAGIAPLGLAVGDFNRDGRLDLVAADASSKVRAFDVNGLNSNPVDLTDSSTTVTLLPGRGDGTFASPILVPARGYPSSVVLADFTGDGADDLAVAASLVMDVTVTVSLGDGTFVSPDTVATAVRSVPLIADLTGEGAADVSVIGHSGRILFRAGRPGAGGSFEAPTVVNPEPEPGARDLALVRTPAGLILAALDAEQPALSFYLPRGDRFVRVAGPAVPGALPTRLIAGDLNGDGLDDLVVAANGSSQVVVYLQTPSGFAPRPSNQLDVGLSPSDLALLDVDGDGRPDIVALSALSDTVSVFLNTPAAHFSSELRFRAGNGLSAPLPHGDGLALQSHDTSVGLVTGDFNSDGTADLVVTHSGANSFSVLSGSGFGGFLNPESARNFTTGSRPTLVVTGHFNADPYVDLAILNEASANLSVFLGDGHGHFASNRLSLSAGNAPTGLTASDINGDGKTDLLVGNAFGDVLALLGNGDGTFQPYQRTDRHMALAVADLNGDGVDDFVFGNEALDRVAVTFGQSGQRFVQDRQDGLLAPGAVRTADLNRDGILDLVVANSGANTVLVYPGIGNGQFGPARSFFAGTDPVGVTIAFLNDDLVPDPADPTRLIDTTPDLVVANQGSNDVTVLLGQGQGADWTLTNGPRLRLFDLVTGQSGIGPVATTVQDVTGDGIPDLLVSSPQSDNVFQIDGVGRGLFDDQAPVVFNTGARSAPVQALVGQFDGNPGLDLITLDSGSNSLTLFSAFGPGRTLGSGGERPVVALAGDFNRDGLSELIVANNDDGHISLLLGTEEGPALARVFSSLAVAHPSDLALSGDETKLYVSGEGEEAIARFTLDFGTAVPLPVAQGGGLGGGEPGQRLADVLPLSETSFATVATFLTVARTENTRAGVHGGDGGVPEVAFNVTALVGSGAGASNTLAPGGGDIAEPVGGAEKELPAEFGKLPARSAEAAADGLTIGVDEALQRSGVSLRKRLLEDDASPASGGVPHAVLEEVFRCWGSESNALGQRLLQSSADLFVSVTSLMNGFAEMAGSLSAVPGFALVNDLVERSLPAALPDERPAAFVDWQPPADGSRARRWENGATFEGVLMVAGFVSGLWLCHQTLPGQQNRRAYERDRPLSENS